MRAGTLVRAAFTAVFGLALALSLVLFYEMYWRWRDCFNEQGRCFDPAASVVYQEQSGEAWGLLAALSAVGLVASIALRRR